MTTLICAILRTMTKRVRKSAVAMLAWMLLLHPAPSARAEELKKVRLAYAGWEVGTAVAYVGIDSGIFRQHGLDIEEVFIRDALAGGIQSLIGVDFVLGFGNPLAILQPVLQGADIVSVFSHVSIEHHRMLVSSEIATIKDLKGKKIGVSAVGGRSDLIARLMLRRFGLDPAEDVEILPIGLAPTRVAALSKNLIQATPLSPDLASQAERLGLKVLDVKSVPVITALLMTTRSFIKRDEEAVRRFVKGYLTAIHYYLTHRNESVAIIKKYFTGTDPTDLETMYDVFAGQLKPVPGPDGEAVQALIDAMSVVDQRAKKMKPADLFDLHFLEELEKSGFIEHLYTEKVSL